MTRPARPPRRRRRGRRLFRRRGRRHRAVDERRRTRRRRGPGRSSGQPRCRRGSSRAVGRRRSPAAARRSPWSCSRRPARPRRRRRSRPRRRWPAATCQALAVADADAGDRVRPEEVEGHAVAPVRNVPRSVSAVARVRPGRPRVRRLRRSSRPRGPRTRRHRRPGRSCRQGRIAGEVVERPAVVGHPAFPSPRGMAPRMPVTPSPATARALGHGERWPVREAVTFADAAPGAMSW